MMINLLFPLQIALRCWLRYLISLLCCVFNYLCNEDGVQSHIKRIWDRINVLRGSCFIGCNSSRIGWAHKTLTVLWSYVHRKLRPYGNLIHFILHCVSVWACWQAGFSRQGQTVIYSAQEALSEGATCSQLAVNVHNSENMLYWLHKADASTLILRILNCASRSDRMKDNEEEEQWKNLDRWE